MPVAVLASGLMRCTRMRSRRGAMLRIDLMADCVREESVSKKFEGWGMSRWISGGGDG